VLHFVELQELLNELKGVLALTAFGELLNFEVFAVEWRCLDIKLGTFFDEPSWESMVLNTEDLICALMLLR
jgi:hypothetical protein